MNKLKVFLLALISITIISFTTSKNTSPKIKIVESSQPLNITTIALKDGQTQLKSDENSNFYVTVSSKKVKGKYLEDGAKIKREGIQYKVTYIYDNFKLDKQTKIKRNIIVWEDNSIIELRSTPKIQVDEIALKAKVAL